jgi:hypothetical protein
VTVVEPEAGHFPETLDEWRTFTDELLELGSQNSKTADIEHVLFHRSLPVDTRHNVKIARIALAAWAADRLPELQVTGRATRPETLAIGEEIAR